MMKILILNWRDIRDPLAGGAEAYLHQIGKRLAREHEVSFYCRRYEGSTARDEIDGIKIMRRGASFSLYLYFIFDYLFRLRRENYAIIVDDINGVPFFTPLFIRKPKVAVMHHLVGREIFFKELPLPLAIVGWAAESVIPLIYRRTPMIAVSNSTRDELIEFGIPEKRIRIVQNAIEHPERNKIEKAEKPTFAYLGRIKEYKQLDHLIKALARVLTEVPQAELVVAGRGDYSELARLAQNSNVSQSIRFMGEVSEEEKAEVLSQAWVFVTPSMKEGWGITVIEANDCGTPAIGYNVPGLRDSIQDGKTGLLVPQGDIDKLADAISKMLSDSELREQFSQNALNWASGFTWDSSAEAFSKVLVEAL
jgi:glycosyltransferase involved in cell wall biosynthesis